MGSDAKGDAKSDGVEVAVSAEASSAHARVNVPLNLDCWKSLPEEVKEQLLWFHQHVLDQRLSWTDATEAVGYDRSTVFRWLKGTYEGSWKNAVTAIKGYRRIMDHRGAIKSNEMVKNGISQMIGAGMDYALANNSIVTITGESRMGKTIASLMWRDDNNHGKSVYVIAPPYGGTKLFLRYIADAVGLNKNMSVPQLSEAMTRSFNKNRMLIVDEAHRLLPGDRRSNPVSLEILRDLHDRTHCGLALIATQRFEDELRKSHYQFEQILGRIGMPIRLPRKIRKGDWMPIVRQYIADPSVKLCEACDQIANDMGRLGILVETLKVASRIASRSGHDMDEETVFKAIALRRQMMGETQYAAK